MFSIGTDIIEIDRIKNAIHRHKMRFIHRIFTLDEQQYCFSKKDPSMHFAARFAAKEAIAKALGTGIGAELGWLDISIMHDEKKKPIVVLSEKAQKIHRASKIEISMSHSKENAIAFALVQKTD